MLFLYQLLYPAKLITQIFRVDFNSSNVVLYIIFINRLNCLFICVLYFLCTFQLTVHCSVVSLDGVYYYSSSASLMSIVNSITNEI